MRVRILKKWEDMDITGWGETSEIIARALRGQEGTPL